MICTCSDVHKRCLRTNSSQPVWVQIPEAIQQNQSFLLVFVLQDKNLPTGLQNKNNLNFLYLSYGFLTCQREFYIMNEVFVPIHIFWEGKNTRQSFVLHIYARHFPFTATGCKILDTVFTQRTEFTCRLISCFCNLGISLLCQAYATAGGWRGLRGYECHDLFMWLG